MTQDALLDAVNGDKRLQSQIKGAIKRIWHRHPVRITVLKRVRFEYYTFKKDGSIGKKKSIWYLCEKCGIACKQARNKKYRHIQVDHVDPTIPVDRPLSGWSEFIKRLFELDPNKLQALCNQCHSEKSREENKLRRG